MNGVMRRIVEGLHRLDVVDPIPDGLKTFGIDPYGPLPEVEQLMSLDRH